MGSIRCSVRAAGPPKATAIIRSATASENWKWSPRMPDQLTGSKSRTNREQNLPNTPKRCCMTQREARRISSIAICGEQRVGGSSSPRFTVRKHSHRRGSDYAARRISSRKGMDGILRTLQPPEANRLRRANPAKMAGPTRVQNHPDYRAIGA
jgi:hypothetical protein